MVFFFWQKNRPQPLKNPQKPPQWSFWAIFGPKLAHRVLTKNLKNWLPWGVLGEFGGGRYIFSRATHMNSSGVQEYVPEGEKISSALPEGPFRPLGTPIFPLGPYGPSGKNWGPSGSESALQGGQEIFIVTSPGTHFISLGVTLSP